jgi:inosose dehydratase
MTEITSHFHFASAPDSWGVLDYPGPSWNQSYEKMLDEMVAAGYRGTELGPYGFFPTDAHVLKAQLEKRGLKLLASFVPVTLSEPKLATSVINHIRKVGRLLADLKAPFLVLADARSQQRDRICGRVPADGSCSLTVEQWRGVTKLVAEADRVAADYGLDLVFHPHVSTYVETPQEVEKFFDATSGIKIGLCLDTGHCYYAAGDPVIEAEKYRSVLRYVHIKDVNDGVLVDSRRKELNFERAIEAGVFTIIGEGNIDFPRFFKTLAKNNYSGWCVVEQDVKFDATVVPPAQSVAASLNYLRGVVSQLEPQHRLS